MIAALQFWREGIIAFLALLLVLQKGETRHFRKLYEGEKAARIQEQAEVRAKTKLAQAQDAAHAAKVERDQVQISQEIASDYQKQLSDLRARYDALRVRGTAKANPGSGRDKAVPGVPDTTSGVDGSPGENGLSAEDALIASEIALRYKGLREWVLGQMRVER